MKYVDFRHISSSSATLSGERVVLSANVLSCHSPSQMTQIASSTGMLVNREDMSKLTSTSSYNIFPAVKTCLYAYNISPAVITVFDYSILY